MMALLGLVTGFGRVRPEQLAAIVSAADPGLQETEVGRGPFVTTEYAVDRRGLHYACVARGLRGYAVWRDGQLDAAEYNAVTRLVFSSDGRHLAYRAVKAEGRVVAVVDGRESPEYYSVHQVALSEDGGTVAWTAMRGDTSFIVLGGREGPHYDAAYIGSLTLSPDGHRFAYVITRTPAQGHSKSQAVVDGQTGPTYEYIGGLTFSANGGHVAYLGVRDNKQIVVVDGRRGPEYDYWARGASTLAFSPDGRHVAYVARKGDGLVAVRDGRESPEYGGVDDVVPSEYTEPGFVPVFSADGRHLAYTACRGQPLQAQWFAVVDGHEGPPYARAWAPTFSDDGKRVAYSAKVRDPETGRVRCTVVVDGKAGPTYDSVRAATFSPDGKSVAYAAEEDGRWLVVLDGKESPPYDDIVGNGPSFHLDGVLEFLAAKERTHFSQTLYRVIWSPKVR